MRTYDDIISDYLLWLHQKTGDSKFLPAHYLASAYPEDEKNARRTIIWQEILDLCYKETEGIYWFTKFILGDMTYAGYPSKIRFNTLWWEWSKVTKTGDHIAIECPRQHGKSTYWTVIQPIYRTAMFEYYNVLVESASEEQAISLLSHIIRIVENNEFLASKKSDGAKWSTTEIAFNGGKIVARGVGSEVRGGTYDYIVCDDILRSDNKLSDDDIEHFVDEELEPMILVRKGQIVIVGTPKSNTDIFTTIEERVELGAGWIFRIYRAIVDWDKKLVLCPDRFTFEQLIKIRRDMTAVKFDKEFMCKTYSAGAQLFPLELRKKAMELGKEWRVYSQSKPEDSTKWRYYIGVDCARAGSASGDYTVAMVLAYNWASQEKRVVWYMRQKGLKIQEQVQHIADLSRKFDNPIILVEQNNMGQDFIDLLIDNYNVNIEAFVTSPKTKEDLIRFLISVFENEKIILPTGDEASVEMMAVLDNELDRFVVEVTKAGNEKMKGSGRSHDDMVMALALANRCSQSEGYQPFESSFPSKHATALEKFMLTGDYKEVYKY